MKHFFKTIPLILCCVLLSISSCQKQDDITESKIESKSPDLLLKIIPRDHLKEMYPTIYHNIQKVNHTNSVAAFEKEQTSSLGFYINDSEIQIIANEYFTTYTCFVFRDNETPNILENYTYKEYANGTYEQYLLTYHYTIDGEGTILYDTSVLDIEVIDDEGILLNKDAGCLPAFVQVVDDYVCTENTRCTGNGRHEAGDSSCLCTPSPSTCDPAGSVSCNYTYAWVYNDCGGGGTTDNTTNDTTNSNTPSGGNSSTSSGDETLSVPVRNPEPAWEFILDCINALTLYGPADQTTIDENIVNRLRLSNEQWETFSSHLSENNCSETAQEEVIEDILDLYDEYQIINELEGKSLCVYNKLKSTSTGFKNAVKQFDGEFPVAHLKFRNSSTIPNNFNAQTLPPSNYLIIIEINENNLNRPNLSIARTIIHETIHAEMFRKILAILDNGGDLDGLTRTEWHNKLSNGDYPGIYDYYSRFGVNGMQHEQIAAHYRATISNILQVLEPGLSQHIYDSLAWVGLKDTVTWNSLSDAEKSSINIIINNFESTGEEDCN